MRHANTTVKLVCLWPVVSNAAVFTPFSACDLLAGMPNYDIGTSSMLCHHQPTSVHLFPSEQRCWRHSIYFPNHLEASIPQLCVPWPQDCSLPLHKFVNPVGTATTKVFHLHFCCIDSCFEFYWYRLNGSISITLWTDSARFSSKFGHLVFLPRRARFLGFIFLAPLPRTSSHVHSYCS